MKTMMRADEAATLIRSGSRLLVSGDENLLRALPRGDWLGGTIPYFMSEDGGLCTHNRLQVTVLPESVSSVTTRFYDVDELERIPRDYRANGFSYIVIPAFSDAHSKFAQDCCTWPGVFDSPLVGWIAGIDLNDLGKVTPKVFDGQTGESSSSKAAVMHVDLPRHSYAKASIINLFRQEDGDTILFPAGGFNVKECLVNGKSRVFAEYLREHAIDSRLPLVANYSGAMVNVSFQKVDSESGKVALYAPVFPGIEYRIAAPVERYEAEFRKQLNGSHIDPVFSCNCILNYLYANLQGKKTGDLVGPMTFGEIAYMLLNQTLVYLTIETA